MIHRQTLQNQEIKRISSDNSGAASEFFTLKEKAVAHIQELCGVHGWTDFNLHDPGVTLLEGMLWSLDDLFYRTREKGHLGISQSLDIPNGLGPVSNEDGLIDRENFLVLALSYFDRLLDVAQASVQEQSKSETERRQFENRESAQQEPLADSANHAKLQVEKQTGITYENCQKLLDADASRAGERGTSLERNSNLTQNQRQIFEVLTWRVRQKLIEKAFQPLLGQMDRYQDKNREGDFPVEIIPYLIKEITRRIKELTGIQITEDEQVVLLSRMDGMPISPGYFENESGLSRIWPPHPSQVLSNTPVTHEDYLTFLVRRLNQNKKRVRQLWMTHGAVAGLRWDGNRNEQDQVDCLRALSVLVLPEPGDGEDLANMSWNQEVLQECRQSMLKEESQKKHSWWGSGDFADARGIGRQLCDELYFGFIKICNVDVYGEILLKPGQPSVDLQQRVQEVLERLIHPSGKLAESIDERGYDSAWQEYYSVEKISFEKILHGWNPGEDIDLAILEKTIRSVGGIEDVRHLRVRIDNGQNELSVGQVAAFSVPLLRKNFISYIATGQRRFDG